MPTVFVKKVLREMFLDLRRTWFFQRRKKVKIGTEQERRTGTENREQKSGNEYQI